MALDHSALLDLLETMRSADENDLMRRALGTIIQAQRHAREDRHHGGG